LKLSQIFCFLLYVFEKVFKLCKFSFIAHESGFAGAGETTVDSKKSFVSVEMSSV